MVSTENKIQEGEIKLWTNQKMYFKGISAVNELEVHKETPFEVINLKKYAWK